MVLQWELSVIPAKMWQQMTEEEYHKILADLGLLDDDDNWELYKEQEKRYSPSTDEENSLWIKYLNLKGHYDK